MWLFLQVPSLTLKSLWVSTIDYCLLSSESNVIGWKKGTLPMKSLRDPCSFHDLMLPPSIHGHQSHNGRRIGSMVIMQEVLEFVWKWQTRFSYILQSRTQSLGPNLMKTEKCGLPVCSEENKISLSMPQNI